jgi:hypothetical protein
MRRAVSGARLRRLLRVDVDAASDAGVGELDGVVD